jgi:plasmid stability protein
MAQLIVRKVEPEVKRKLQQRAIRHGCSMEQEIRDILRNAVKDDQGGARNRVGSRIAALFADIGLDADIPELHGEPIRPVRFDDDNP